MQHIETTEMISAKIMKMGIGKGEIFRSETTSNVLPVCREIVGKVKEKKSTDLIACISHPKHLYKGVHAT
uniref:Uncharacterized protein n=1 Tax=Vitis vinifera TaxID=29760 RepID=F6GZJ9_VITVI